MSDSRFFRLVASIFLALFLISVPASAAKLPGEVWSWDRAINPESVLVDESTDSIFISNIVGDPNKKDGVGWISRLSIKGKIRDVKWVKGLNAPKGLALHQGFLWVSDIQDLVQIDIATKKVITKVAISGSKFLNDVVVGPSGEVYVADTLTSRIYLYKDAKVSVFAEGDEMESPNGLWISGGRLIVAAWGKTEDFSTKVFGRVFSVDLATKKKTLITPEPVGNLDGLFVDTDGNYWVSDWSSGKVFRISPQGKKEAVLSGVAGIADFSYVPSKKWLILPRLLENKVTAIDMKRLKVLP